jgi:hypothetical protein
MPHGGARRAFLLSPDRKNVQQAKTTKEVKILAAVKSGVAN